MGTGMALTAEDQGWCLPGAASLEAELILCAK